MGSVSGGCVEGEMVKHATKIFEGNASLKLRFGVADEDAWKVGLPCGGAIHTFLQSFDPHDAVWNAVIDSSASNTPCVVITSIEDGGFKQMFYNLADERTLGDRIDAIQQIKHAFKERSHKVVEINNTAYFIQLFPRKPLLLAIGAAHITADLVAFGNQFGFETVVIDPRGFFANNTVFASPPSRIISEYPSEILPEIQIDHYTYCAILSHDPKIDDDALEYLLDKDVAYIGALGSKKRHERRKQKLVEKGYSQEQVDSIHGPIGIDINSITAKEIALSIMSEIIKIQNQFVKENIKN